MSSLRSFSSSTQPSGSGTRLGGGVGGGSSMFASVSNLASRDLLQQQGSEPLLEAAARRGIRLPEELETRSGWTVVTEPQYLQLAQAIVEDNYNRMESFVPQLAELANRLSGFKIELTTRSGVRISCRNMFLGHLLALCASPRVLQLLRTHELLSVRLFAKKLDLSINFEADDECQLPADSVFAAEFRKFDWRSVPSYFMLLLRDTFDSFEWLLRHGFVRKLTDTDGSGRNILHAAIEMESPLLLSRLLTKESCCSPEMLERLMKQTEAGTGHTPLLKACSATNVAMLLVILQNLPRPFLVGQLDASGHQESIISAIIRHVKDPAIGLELVTLLLQRGATPDTAYFDKRGSIEVLVTSEHFSGHDLCHLVADLVRHKAKVDLSVMIHCLSCRFRTDDEILEIALELLGSAGAAALTDKHQAEMREMGEESFDMESNVVVQMLRNPQISPGTVRHLLKHFAGHINISSIFPTVPQLAKALVQGIWAEMRISSGDDDEAEGRAVLTPEGLGQVLESLSVFTTAAHRDSIRQQRYKDSLLHSIVSILFRETNFAAALLPKEKLTKLVPQYLAVMERAQLDMNAMVDGKVSLFAAFEPTTPGWLSLSLLRQMPDSFNFSIRDKRGNNLAVVLMRTFSKRYRMLLSGLKSLKSLKFGLGCEVLAKYNLLMAFVDICGSGFKELEEADALDEAKAGEFLEVFNFLMSEGIDVYHSVAHKDVDDHPVTVNALSLSMVTGVSLLVLELLRRHPDLLYSVKPKTILKSLRDFPELLEMLNSRIQCRDHVANGVKTQQQQEGQQQQQCRSTIRSHWRLYVQRNHIQLLKLANEDEDNLQCMLLVYDYFQECLTHVPPEEEDQQQHTPAKGKKLKQSGGKKKVVVLGANMQQEVLHQRGTKRSRINSKLMLTIADNPVLKQHPMVSEYLERFYLRALLVAVLMNLFHLLYLSLLVGHVSWITTNKLNQAGHFSGFHLSRTPDQVRVTGFFECRHRRCAGNEFFVHHLRLCSPDPANTSCSLCTGRLLEKSPCLPEASAQFSRCPVYDWDRGSFWITPCQYILITISAVTLLKELSQLITKPKVYWRHSIQNLVEAVMYILILLCSINVTECPWSSGFREEWQHNAAIVAVFLAWSMMFFYMSRFQAFGTYVMMFYTSVRTGLWLLTAFLCIIMGYVQVFHMLLKNQFAFNNLWVSFLKVVEMMVGGLDYNDIFASMYDREEGVYSTRDQDMVHEDFFTRIVYLSFIITMTVVLMNLFIGLIVGDVEKINREAEVKTWSNCIAFIDIAQDMLEWTSLLSDKIREWRSGGCCSRDTEAAAATSDGEVSAAAAEEQQPSVRVNLKDLRKSPMMTKILGLVNRKELSDRLLACEKRKLRVKILTKNLHNRLPFLYTVFDPCAGDECGTEIDLSCLQADDRHKEAMHTCHETDRGESLRRLAVPEDVQTDDPFLRRTRNALVFPNRLNRLRVHQHPLNSISEDTDA